MATGIFYKVAFSTTPKALETMREFNMVADFPIVHFEKVDESLSFIKLTACTVEPFMERKKQ